MAPTAVVVIPVKDFDRAKVRLSASLDGPTRAALAREMATTVVRAAASLPVSIVCDSPAVRDWAADVGADVLWTPGLGLNGAVQEGVARLAAAGVSRAIVAHADLPLADSFDWLATGDGVIVVPDRHLDGTNVISVPTAVGFTFAYGPGSFAAHRTEAARCNQILRVVRDDRLGWDVDHPADLKLPCT